VVVAWRYIIIQPLRWRMCRDAFAVFPGQVFYHKTGLLGITFGKSGVFGGFSFSKRFKLPGKSARILYYGSVKPRQWYFSI
jgi:hypothetical protein